MSAVTPSSPFLPCPGEPSLPFHTWLKMFPNYLLVVASSAEEWPDVWKRALLCNCKLYYYVHFCTDCVIPTKTVHCFPNNKPWVTKDIKASLNRKKAAFRSGDKEMKKVQRELRENIKEAKECHGAKTIQGKEGNLDEANESNRFDDVAPPVTPLPSLSPPSPPYPPSRANHHHGRGCEK